MVDFIRDLEQGFFASQFADDDLQLIKTLLGELEPTDSGSAEKSGTAENSDGFLPQFYQQPDPSYIQPISAQQDLSTHLAPSAVVNTSHHSKAPRVIQTLPGPLPTLNTKGNSTSTGTAAAPVKKVKKRGRDNKEKLAEAEMLYKQKAEMYEKLARENSMLKFRHRVLDKLVNTRSEQLRVLKVTDSGSQRSGNSPDSYSPSPEAAAHLSGPMGTLLCPPLPQPPEDMSPETSVVGALKWAEANRTLEDHDKFRTIGAQQYISR
eukprot:CAMPEP_0202919416 /NCGR_PEP_ID=MMETSP1392-20130828/75776_1 /ASSEMBLY_ACC=CAM_ASM_000868 /TAXON_ID=225041 /ORGANISM="Chlamydomonas chlamydogama, Strain SAG 11-48b" /LENGTH=263 /DNA_ID=CAMNT_0049612765 /DNA_START=65 /DNA_END=852 /DNA_ORIENTATION=+